MQVRHGDAAEHRADDTEETLIGAGEVEVVQVGAAVLDSICYFVFHFFPVCSSVIKVPFGNSI